MPADITCIVVTFNSRHTIDASLAPLASTPWIRITVVDNASTDGTVEHIRATYPDVALIERARNDGFAVGVNAGLRARSPGHVLLLNPDAVLSSTALEDLRDVLEKHPEIGIVAPLISHPQGRLETWQAGRSMSLWSLFTHYSGLSRLSYRIRALEGTYRRADAPAAVLQPVDWVSGGCLLVRDATLAAVGELSERWFMYGEDREFCDRVRREGWQIAVATAVPARHLVGGSSTAGVGGRSLWIENSFDYFVTSGSRGPLSRAAWRLIVGTGLSARALGYGLRSARSRDAGGRALWAAERAKFWRFAATAYSARTLERRPGTRATGL